jgi:hypothetical protein
MQEEKKKKKRRRIRLDIVSMDQENETVKDDNSACSDVGMSR